MTSGLSLAINSAPRLSVNSTKIHISVEDLLNHANRRLLRGDNVISMLPAFKADARINPGYERSPSFYQQADQREMNSAKTTG